MNTNTGTHDKGDIVHWHGLKAAVLSVRAGGEELLIELQQSNDLYRFGERIEVQRWHLDRE